ncbi:MAG: hypothetical protein SOU51_07320 [Collinsella sp.]|nr:hypothetical protein [Collinsella sp.]
MLNLLRSDLYRATRIRGLRGLMWQYLLVILVCTLLDTAGLWMSIRAGAVPDVSALITTPSTFIAKQSLGPSSIVVIASAIGLTEFIFSDLGDSYMRTIVSSLRGRLPYLAEKIVLAGVWTGILLIASCVLALIAFWVLISIPYGIGFSKMDDALPVVAWVLESWLVSWASALISLPIALLVRRKLPTYLLVMIAQLGFMSFALTLGANIIQAQGGSSPLLESLASALLVAAMWLPETVLGTLSAGAGIMGDASQLMTFAGPLPTWLWALAVGAVWLLLSGGMLILIGSKRDL